MALNKIDLNTVRKKRNQILKELVDPKSCEAFASGATLSTNWQTYRQSLLDITDQDVEIIQDLTWPEPPQDLI